MTIQWNHLIPKIFRRWVWWKTFPRRTYPPGTLVSTSSTTWCPIHCLMIWSNGWTWLGPMTLWPPWNWYVILEVWEALESLIKKGFTSRLFGFTNLTLKPWLSISRPRQILVASRTFLRFSIGFSMALRFVNSQSKAGTKRRERREIYMWIFTRRKRCKRKEYWRKWRRFLRRKLELWGKRGRFLRLKLLWIGITMTQIIVSFLIVSVMGLLSFWNRIWSLGVMGRFFRFVSQRNGVQRLIRHTTNRNAKGLWGGFFRESVTRSMRGLRRHIMLLGLEIGWGNKFLFRCIRHWNCQSFSWVTNNEILCHIIGLRQWRWRGIISEAW